VPHGFLRWNHQNPHSPTTFLSPRVTTFLFFGIQISRSSPRLPREKAPVTLLRNSFFLPPPIFSPLLSYRPSPLRVPDPQRVFDGFLPIKNSSHISSARSHRLSINCFLLYDQQTSSPHRRFQSTAVDTPCCHGGLELALPPHPTRPLGPVFRDPADISQLPTATPQTPFFVAFYVP